MSYYGNNVVSVKAHGSAETKFLFAAFKASVTAYGKTGPAAKSEAIPRITALKETIAAHVSKAKIDIKQLKTTFSVGLHTNRNTGAFEGYKAEYTIDFNARNVAAAPDVHDALTTCEGVMASTPVYHLDESPEVQARAFLEAAERAKKKFADQCAATGLDTDRFELASWAIESEEPRGKTIGFTEDTSNKIGLEPGGAILDMRVTFAYVARENKKNKNAEDVYLDRIREIRSQSRLT